ncbi:rhomboid family intramembrane serine protease [Luteolibacter luteus]|uniref:Rhomboid family intramembrane serine protease n=1 Tax=Luteolibacter luteus TaxID=2728835 RepID=A0A858RDC1_9BACT|nr:rhomboid family intramembrane serine protease [Luteolibacter luteus]QJE94631.1 rhomboid family intramembrane serine protease [Luteolibacter luteus]
MHLPTVTQRSGDRWRWVIADLRGAKLCWLLVLVIAAVYGGMCFASDDRLDWLFLTFGLSRQGLLEGKVWQLVSHAFLHGNITHLAINAAGLLLIGARVERIGGASAVAKVLLAGVLLGGLVQVIAAPSPHRDFQLVGISGGFTALLLWLTTVSPESRMAPLPISAKNLGRGIILAEGMFLVGSWFLPEAGFQVVAHGCHFGGALAGWWIGRRMMRPTVTLEDLQRERAKREGGEQPKLP